MGRCRLYNISYTVEPASIAVPLKRIPYSSWCGIQWQLVMVSSTGLLGSCSHCSAHHIMGADVLSTHYLLAPAIASLHFPACSNGGNVVHVVSCRMNKMKWVGIGSHALVTNRFCQTLSTLLPTPLLLHA